MHVKFVLSVGVRVGWLRDARSNLQSQVETVYVQEDRNKRLGVRRTDDSERRTNHSSHTQTTRKHDN